MERTTTFNPSIDVNTITRVKVSQDKLLDSQPINQGFKRAQNV